MFPLLSCFQGRYRTQISKKLLGTGGNTREIMNWFWSKISHFRDDVVLHVWGVAMLDFFLYQQARINTGLLQSKCETIPALCYSGAQIRQLSSWKKEAAAAGFSWSLLWAREAEERRFSSSQCDTSFLHFHQPVLNYKGTILCSALPLLLFCMEIGPPVLSVWHFHKCEITSLRLLWKN